MKAIQSLPEIAKTYLIESRLRSLKSLKLRKNGAYGKRCRTLLHLACKYSSLKIVKHCLSRHPASISKLTRDKYSCLHFSSLSGNLSLVKFIFKQCPKLLNLQTNRGETSLHLSCKSSSFNTAKFLIQKSALLHLQDKKGWTVGHWAAYHGSLDTLILLKSKNFDFSMKNSNGESILHIAAWNGDLSCFQFLSQILDVREISIKGSVVDYCKGNWQLLYWIFENKVLRGKFYIKNLYLIQAPLEIFNVAGVEVRINDVILYDRDDLLEILIEKGEIDIKFLKVLVRNSGYKFSKCMKSIERLFKWDRVKVLVFWDKFGKDSLPKGLFCEVLSFI